MAINLNIKLTQKQQQNLVLAILLIGGLGYAYWNYLLNPMIMKYNEKSKMLQEKRKDLKDARELVAKYDEFLKKAALINKKIDFINKRLPATMSISDIVRELTDKAAISNIKIISFRPAEKVTVKENYKEMLIDVSMVSNFNNFGNFLTNLGYIEKVLSPINPVIVSMPEDENGNNLKISMMVKVYLFQD